jgi:NitT/TauT family transport system permease protein
MPATTEVADDERLREEQRGLDKLELALPQRKSRTRKFWFAVWPKVAAVGLFFFVWQCIVWSGWKPEYVLPGPVPVIERLVTDADIYSEAALRTLQRAVLGFLLAVAIGTVLGAAVARVPLLRSAVGSMVTGLQTMPSIAWFPLAIILFQLTEGAILFVVVLGAAPSVANGLIAGIDTIPPLMLRTGRVLGAQGVATFRHVIIPAALPTFVGGLKQGWAFAWRSLLAGELLVLIPGTFSLGQRLQFSAEFNDAEGVLAAMIVIFIVGVIVDALFFAQAERWVRRRYGLVDAATGR